MKRNEFLFFFASVSFLIILLWYIGLFFSLYWIFGWYDLMMHFLGGFWIGLITYILFLYGSEENISSSRNLIFSIAMTILLVGIMWEWLELKRGLASFSADNYFTDTITDLIVDILGAFVSYSVVLNWKNIIK